MTTADIELLVAEYLEWALERGGRPPEVLLAELETDAEGLEFARRIDEVNVLLGLCGADAATVAALSNENHRFA